MRRRIVAGARSGRALAGRSFHRDASQAVSVLGRQKGLRHGFSHSIELRDSPTTVSRAIATAIGQRPHSAALAALAGWVRQWRPQRQVGTPCNRRRACDSCRGVFQSRSTASRKSPPVVATKSGRGGIRTPGTLRHAGFQDRCIRPLCHPTGG